MVCFPSVMFSCPGSCADLIRYAVLNCLQVAYPLNFVTTLQVIFILYFLDEVTELWDCITFWHSCRWEVSEFRFESRSVTLKPRVINFDTMCDTIKLDLHPHLHTCFTHSQWTTFGNEDMTDRQFLHIFTDWKVNLSQQSWDSQKRLIRFRLHERKCGSEPTMQAWARPHL